MMILEQTLPTLIPSELINNNTTLTIFCPTDNAFFSLKYPQPPFTLLQYHIFPTKLNKEALKSSHPCESKLDTLLGGHPLVVTTLPKSQSASINEVKIKDWEIFNDGQVIVQGIEDFFNPTM
ncbi:putative fasciclin-like arabinogalactan protein 20 [Camellia lanceoleosa]|uniref:Fasciclin-like arabinogalactan protein 20 n=1 Tax=Camellia lanceoleosa TaxID=1840588 RepID=A0ACC0GDX8_9ERIC|nr:putative fasciclin-like arabinogalactan protein 20 [Camellia lanceoleosa]